MNMRKIIAMLAAVLMLCAAIPMGVMSVTAAPGDVIIDADFNDGMDGFTNHSVIDGALVIDGTSADWANSFIYAGFKPGVKYQVTFSAKADTPQTLSFKINNGWNGTNVSEGAALTTEYAEYELFLTPDANLVEPIFTIQTNTEAKDGTIFYIDWVKVVEYKEPAVPGQIVNGDFETGEANGWNLPQQGSVTADAAHSGNYGINIKGNGGWGGMLDQNIPVEAGKTYEISLWYKINNNGVNIQVKDGGTSGPNLQSTFVRNSEWTQITWLVTPTTDILCINFCGSGDGAELAEDAYVDDVVVKELKDPSFDGYIYNGDFETGKIDHWNIYQSTNISAEAAHTGDYGVHIVGVGNWGGLLEQEISGLTVGKSYSFTFWFKINHQGVNVKIGDSYVGWFKTVGEWEQITHEFTATSETAKLLINGGGDGNANPDLAADIYVDDFALKEIIDPSYDGYIYNGDFETGDVFPWDNLWGSCSVVEIVEGMDGGYGLSIVSGQWKHVRQTNIAVEANTDYKITAWVKNAATMSLLVKDGGDSKDIVNAGVSAGDEWTEITKVFNTGDYTTIIFSLMGGAGEEGTQYGTFDNIKIEKIGEHNYELTDGTFPTCDTEGSATYTCSCGASYTETLPAYHNGGMEYNPAKEAIDCANPGNIENYFCPGCYEYFADAYAQEIINPWFIQITVDCVRPEGIADCATVTCETCGNEIYGYGEHDVLVCQGGTCSKCNAEIEGAGCQNYDTPACEDGVCYYCGGFVAGFGHENGAWAACCDGECAYGCGLIYPATEDHVDEDGNDYCDNCWSHLACIDEDGNGECDLCWREMPATDIIYGDANGDGEINILDEAVLAQYNAGWDVTLDEAAADANGDGEINILDEALLAQYNAGWDVVLGG